MDVNNQSRLTVIFLGNDSTKQHNSYSSAEIQFDHFGTIQNNFKNDTEHNFDQITFIVVAKTIKWLVWL